MSYEKNGCGVFDWVRGLGIALLLGAACAHAQEFGSRPITMVVGYPPGGSNDIGARIIAPRLAEMLGASVVVVNKSGANATIAADFVAKAAPDGHTLLVASASPLVIVPHTAAKIPYDTVNDFVAISLVGLTPEAVGIGPSVTARNLKELVELARSRQVTIASSGSGGMPHLAIELFKLNSGGAKIVHVPYKGASMAVIDVMGGHVDGVIGDYASLLSLFKEGKVRPLAVTSDKRVDSMPEIPTSAEQGFPNFIAENWLGVLAPAKTPKVLTDRIYAALVRIVADPQIKAQLNNGGLSAVSSTSPDAFQKFLKDEFDKWGKIARDSGARAD